MAASDGTKLAAVARQQIVRASAEERTLSSAEEPKGFAPTLYRCNAASVYSMFVCFQEWPYPHGEHCGRTLHKIIVWTCIGAIVSCGWCDANRGRFNVSADLFGPVAGEVPHLPDTFLRMPGFTKGVAFVNGFNLGWCASGRLPARSRCSQRNLCTAEMDALLTAPDIADAILRGGACKSECLPDLRWG